MSFQADLVVIVPSRGRPEAAADLAHTIARTSTALTAVIVAADLDDPSAEQYPQCARDVPVMPGLLTLEPTRSAAEALNRAALRYASGSFAVAYLPDCHQPVASGWDRHLVDALRAGHGFAHGHEVATVGGARPRHIAMRSDVIAALGMMVPEELAPPLWSYCWARWAGEVGGVAVCDDVVIARAPGIPARASAQGAPWYEYSQTRLAGDVATLRRVARSWSGPAEVG